MPEASCHVLFNYMNQYSRKELLLFFFNKEIYLIFFKIMGQFTVSVAFPHIFSYAKD